MKTLLACLSLAAVLVHGQTSQAQGLSFQDKGHSRLAQIETPSSPDQTAEAQGQVRWQPQRTYVLVASITSWPAKSGLHSFEDTGEDAKLAQKFKDAGVPAGNVVFLKNSEATHTGMRDALQKLGQRGHADDTLVFCFQGHGGRKILYSYDYDPKHSDETVFHMEDIYPTLEKWQGNRLFLVGDCCCSGSLRSVLHQFEQKRPDVRVAALASSTASNSSTGNWTFTEGIIRALEGDPLIDRNHDGNLSMAEVDQFLHDQMKYKEDQLASLTLSANFEKDFVFRPVAAGKKLPQIPGAYQVGDTIDAQDMEGKWYASEILDWKKDNGGLYYVHYVGWADKWNEWVNINHLRQITKPKLKVGGHYEVLWGKKWYPATLTKTVEDYFYFVHYENENGEDDEWITPERARLPKDQAAPQPEFASLESKPPVAGMMVAAQYEKEWYRGEVASVKNGVVAMNWDDHTTSKVAVGEVIPIASAGELRVGDRVLALWDEDSKFYPAKVLSIVSDKASVRWEDGSSPTKVPLKAIARIQR